MRERKEEEGRGERGKRMRIIPFLLLNPRSRSPDPSCPHVPLCPFCECNLLAYLAAYNLVTVNTFFKKNTKIKETNKIN